MIRTQIYLPEDIHRDLSRLARMEKTTLSQLIREGSERVLRTRVGKKTPQQKALEFFANPPKNLRINLNGKSAVELVRQERD